MYRSTPASADSNEVEGLARCASTGLTARSISGTAYIRNQLNPRGGVRRCTLLVGSGGSERF